MKSSNSNQRFSPQHYRSLLATQKVAIIANLDVTRWVAFWTVVIDRIRTRLVGNHRGSVLKFECRNSASDNHSNEQTVDHRKVAEDRINWVPSRRTECHFASHNREVCGRARFECKSFDVLNSVAVEQEEVVAKRQYNIDGRGYYQVCTSTDCFKSVFVTGHSTSCSLHSLRTGCIISLAWQLHRCAYLIGIKFRFFRISLAELRRYSDYSGWWTAVGFFGAGLIFVPVSSSTQVELQELRKALDSFRII